MIMTVVLIFPAIVLADEDDLVVEFESTPLFSEANFLPGNTITRTVEVTNNTEGAKDIIAEAINVSDPDDFSEVLGLVITEDENELYNDTLANFFEEGEANLSSITGLGGSAIYNFSISFLPDSGNGYQENELGFDILVGFRGEGGNEDGGDDGSGSAAAAFGANCEEEATSSRWIVTLSWPICPCVFTPTPVVRSMINVRPSASTLPIPLSP